MPPDSFFRLHGSPPRSRWYGLFWLTIFYLGALAFAAIFAAPLYHAVQSWHASNPNDLNTYLTGKEFQKYFDRLRWVFALLALPLLFYALGFFPYARLRRLARPVNPLRIFLAAMSAGFHRLGLRCGLRDWARFGRWFLAGVALAGVIAAGQLVFTLTQPKADLDAAQILKIALGSLAGGLALGFLEETLFRGIVLRCFYTAFRPLMAVMLGSAFFAYTHFKHPGALFTAANQDPGFAAGLAVAYHTLFGILQSFAWLPFLNLFMFGNLLCLITLRTRSLMSAAGLHAGAVFIMLTNRRCFHIHPDEARLLWGGGGIIDGILPLVLLTLLTLIAYRWYLSKDTKAQEPSLR